MSGVHFFLVLCVLLFMLLKALGIFPLSTVLCPMFLDPLFTGVILAFTVCSPAPQNYSHSAFCGGMWEPVHTVLDPELGWGACPWGCKLGVSLPTSGGESVST